MKKTHYRLLKRGADAAIAFVALLLLSPLLLLIGLLIRLESRGPALYRSRRVGEGYRIFELYKFRTMCVGADRDLDKMAAFNQYGWRQPEARHRDCPFCKSLGRTCSPLLYADGEQVCENFHLMRQEQEKQAAFFKFAADPRITPLGRVLRNTSLDELPQLLNVLKGDMALVGNRPLPLYEAEKLTVDHAISRFDAPAGITGLWQVNRRGKPDMDEQERIELDKTYARDYSLSLDLRILFKTIPALLQESNV